VTKDQLFKEVVREFFQEFVTLFLPDVASQLDFSQVTFPNKEMFTDFPDGAQRNADLLAEVYTKDGEPEFLLFHTEVQATRRSEFPYRMWEYYALLRLRHKRRVFPVVIYLAPGTGGVTQERYREELFGRTLLQFEYDAIGLPDLNAADWEVRGDPFASALSVLMKARQASRVRRRFEATKNIVRSSLNDAKKFLLMNVLYTFLPLNAQEYQEFEMLVVNEKAEDIEDAMETYEDTLVLRGMTRGIQQGIQEGIQQGLLQGQRNAVLRQMRKRFDDLPADIVATVEAIQEEAQLDTLLDEVITVTTWKEMSFPA